MALLAPLPDKRVLFRTTSAAPESAPKRAQPVPCITQLSTISVTAEPEARIGPPEDWIVAPLQTIVLLLDSANSVIVYVVPPFSVTVVPAALSSGARWTADAHAAAPKTNRPKRMW